MPETGPGPTVRPYTPTALPSVTARLLAFVAILVGGLCGGLISYSLADIQCGSDDRAAATIVDGTPEDGGTASAAPAEEDDGCSTLSGVAGLIGAAVVAAGVAVISVLVLRAMAEWRRDLDVAEGRGTAPTDGDAVARKRGDPQRTSRSLRKPSA